MSAMHQGCCKAVPEAPSYHLTFLLSVALLLCGHQGIPIGL